MFRHSVVAGFFTCLFLVPGLFSPLQEQPLEEDNLARAVPSDNFLCYRSKPNPERDVLLRHYGETLEVLKNCGFIEEVHAAILQLIPEENREYACGLMDRFLKVFWMIDWIELARHEVVWAEGMPQGLVNVIVLVRSDPGCATKTFNAFRELLAGLTFISDELQLESNRYRGADITSLTTIREEPLHLSVFRKGDVLGGSFPFRAQLLESLDQLEGSGSSVPLIATERYTRAMEGLPPGKDLVGYFDIGKMLGLIGTRFDTVYSSLSQKEAERIPILLLSSLVEELDLFDYVVESQSTTGDTVFNTTKLQLKRGASRKRLFAPLFNRRPVEHFERFVPADAVAFSVSSGVDLLPLYDSVVELVSEQIPGAEGLLAHWTAVQREAGIDVREDLLAWLEGGVLSVERPASRPTPFMKTGRVILLRLREEGAGRVLEGVAKGLEGVGTLLQRLGMQLTVKEIERQGLQGGKECALSVLPFYKIFIGVHGDFLVAGWPTQDVLAYIDFLEKGGPNVLDTDLFDSLGLRPPSSLYSISYQNLEGKLEGVKAVLAGFSMASMAFPSESPESRFIKRCIGAFPRLLPVFDTFDYADFELTIRELDLAEGTIITQSVTKLK